MKRIKSNFELQGYDVGVLSRSDDPVIITNPNIYDNPIIYVNKAFEDVFGYESRDIIGCNFRFLNGKENKQEGLYKINDAIKNNDSVTSLIRSYTVDSSLVLNEMSVGPIFDKESGKIKYILSIQKILKS